MKLNLINRINYLVKNIKEELIKVRRKLHEYPELGLEEKNTGKPAPTPKKTKPLKKKIK